MRMQKLRKLLKPEYAVSNANGWNASTGIRQQPLGFSKVQVIATALDPRFKDLLGIPIGNVQLMLKQAVLEEITRKTKSTTTTTDAKAETATV